jgi:homoserine O-acetyltransferase
MSIRIDDASQSQASSIEITIAEGILELPDPLPLHFGGSLASVRIAWRMVGAADAPIVAVLGGISAGRNVCSASKGWWRHVVGEEGALDTRRWRVLGIDYLGGSGATTGPKCGQQDFPSVSAYDQADALKQLLAHLKIPVLRAIVGASYGGMVALAFAERSPSLVQDLIVISASDHAHPMATAWRSVQRSIVKLTAAAGQGAEGLRLARALAMATYRSFEEFEARFTSAPKRTASGFQFPVESYLYARGDAYAQSYVPEAFVCLSESIDLHSVDPMQIHVPVTLIGVREDQLVPMAHMQALKSSLPRAKLVELSSIYGHDAFLKEVEQLRPVFVRVLESKS